MTTVRKLEVCDACATAVYDEAPADDMSGDDIAALASVYGSSIGDHECEAPESGEICDCRCYGARQAHRARQATRRPS